MSSSTRFSMEAIWAGEKDNSGCWVWVCFAFPFFDCAAVAERPEGCKIGTGTLRSKNIRVSTATSEATQSSLTV